MELYWYNAYVTGVYDGDTITVNIDLGFNTVINGMKIRLADIDTPELRGDERERGLISRDWLREKVLNKWINVNTVKDSKGKYGRYIAHIYIDGENINETLLAEGLADKY
jgi:micrococcal nuclease